MKRISTRLTTLLLACLFVPMQMMAVVWYKTDAYGNPDPTDPARDRTNCFKSKGGPSAAAYSQLEPNTEYCRIYRYKYGTQTGDNDGNFEDPELRYYLARHFNYVPTGYVDQCRFYITKEEADTVTDLDLSKAKYSRSSMIYNLNGIQIFRNLKKLNISEQNGSSYSSEAGSYRDLGFGYIPSYVYNAESHKYLNLPKTEMAKALPSNYGGAGYNDARRHYLSWLLLFFPELEELNCSGLTSLEYLHIDNGTAANRRPLKKLICSNCPYLYSVKANYTELAELDVTGCPYLVTLEVHHANLTSINVADNTRLATLDLEHNGISTIIRNTTEVTHYRTYFDEGSGIGYTIDYSVEKTGIYPFLEVLNLRNNNLHQEALTNLNQCPSLRLLKCQYNHLTALDFNKAAPLEGVWCGWNDITTLTFDENDTNLHTLECQHNKLTSLNLSGGKLPNIRFLDCSENENLASLIFDTGTGDHPDLHTVYAYKCGLTDESNLNFSALSGLKKLRLSDNTLSTIDLSNNTLVEDIYVNRCGMSSITGFSSLNSLQTFMANENNFSEATMSFAGKSALVTCELEGNKFRTLDFTGCNALVTLKCNRQGLYYPGGVETVKDGCGNGRILSVLKVTSPVLTTLACQNNALLTLDLSACSNLTVSGFSSWAQRAEQDLIVVDKSKVLLPLPNGINADMLPSNLGKYFHTWSNENSASGFDINCGSIVNADGTAYELPRDAANTPYLVVYDIARSDEHKSALADVNFYDNTLKYIYYTFFDGDGNPYLDDALGKSQANGNPDDNIEVKCYPYIMYINPSSQDKHSKYDESLSETKQFYSGTLILEYDAIVPAGATAYIAKNVQVAKDVYYSSVNGGATKVTANQLRLVEIEPGEGATNVVIPANTPIYVKADDASGLYGFHRAEHPDYLVGGKVQPYGVAADGSDLIKDNILQGTLVPLAVSRGSVLTLGRSRIMGETGLGGVTSESRIGFWPFNGTTVPAHRVYIPATAVDNAVLESSSRGLLFSFF
ncbi:MAG: hypothetical protein IKI05_05175, partial [Bacteroidaceae bacterium]|nr:hypothetical protein [Bacteroidaceae bacterium]